MPSTSCACRLNWSLSSSRPTPTPAASITPAITVEVRDASNILVNSATNAITLSISTNPAGGTLSGTTTVNAVNGVATFSGLSINNPGDGYVLTATASGLTSAVSNSFNILRVPTQLVFVQQPTNTDAAASITPAITVEVRDASNALVTTASNAVTLAISTNPAGGTLSGTTTVNAVNGVATFSGLSINNPGDGYVLTASSPGLTNAVSNAFNILRIPTQLVFVQQPTNTDAAASITPAITVEVRDASNILVNSASNAITLSISTNPAGGTLSGTTTVNAVNGVATFSGLSINNPGDGYVLTASSPGLTNAVSNSFNILRVPTQLVFVQQPTNTNASASITPAITVEIRDASNILVTTATNAVTLSISTNPSGGTLSGTTTVNAVNGVATFSGLSINLPGNGYVLTASSPGLTNAVSNAFNITIGIIINRTDPALGVTDDVSIVAEGATIGDRFTFSLTVHPTADVAVTFSSTNAAQLKIIDPSQGNGYFPADSYTVTFSASGASGTNIVPWNTPVVISLYGVPDGVAESPTTYGVHFGFSSTDPAYGTLTIPDEPVTVYDAGVTITPMSFNLNEGTSSSYSIVLNGPPGVLVQPSGSSGEIVTVTLGSSTPKLSVGAAAATFTRANWNTPQTINVTSIDDSIATGDYIVGIANTVSSNIDLNKNLTSFYGGSAAPAPVVMVQIIEQDGVPPPPPPPPAIEIPPVLFTTPDQPPATPTTNAGVQ